MSTRTPGPWTIEDDTSECVVSRDPEANEFHIVARTYGPDEAANARLIAAAPDLLAALQAIEGLLFDDIDNPMVKEHWELARAAIAKAEGVS